MNAITVRDAAGKLICFGPDNGMYDPGVPVGCVKAIEPDYEAGMAEWQAQQAPLQYQQLRAAAYPSFADQFDLLYHGGIEAWKAEIQAVKTRYPKELL